MVWIIVLFSRCSARVCPSALSELGTARIRVPLPDRRRHLRLVGGALLLSSGLAAAEVPEIALQPRVGHAYSLDTGELLYRELHHPQTDGDRLQGDRVEYRGPDGELLARKMVDYTPDPLSPAFRLEDLRTGYIEGLEWRDGGQAVLFTRSDEQASLEREPVSSENLVADAGFDMLIYRNLDQLQQGATPEFPFAVPSRLDTVTFRLRTLGRQRVLTREATVIRMEPANPLLRWLVDPVEVAYDAESGALLRYEGISNLPVANGSGNYRVRIDFPPTGVSPQPPIPAEEQRADRR